jgi:mono/diheme cytochrome c family protein
MPDDRKKQELETREELEASTQKWMLAGLVLMALFVLAFPIFRFYEPAQRADARESQSSFFAAEGAELFEVSCAECHGPAGSGAIAPAIGSAEFLASVTDEQISQLTALGVPGSEMVAYSNDYGGPMTATEIRSITTYLRSLEEDAPSIPAWRAPLEVSDFSAAELYSLACARCHGVDREGIEGVAPDISTDSLTMLEDDAWITSRIGEGFKDMPRFNRTLSDVQIAAIVTYLRTGGDVQPSATPTTTTTVPAGDTTATTAAGGEEATTTTLGEPRSPDNDDVLALGEAIYIERFGFAGCQECHGLDLNGTSQGPSILGTSRSGIATALSGVPDMEVDKTLTNEEIEAVYQYTVWVRDQR